MSLRAKIPTLSPTEAWRLARIVVIAGFVLLIGRYWNPYYGFTSLLQADPVTESLLPESLRDTPVFIHRDAGRYDGVYYAQIATSPALHDPAVAEAVDDVGYRARRILLSAIAWAAGGGDPVRAVHVYAWLNVILWFGFAALLWRVLPVEVGGRAQLGWVALLLTSGTLASVRLALTDLAAVTLLAAALHQSEKGRSAVSTVFLGLGGLARETALLGLSALLPEARLDLRGLARRGGLCLLAVLPLTLAFNVVAVRRRAAVLWLVLGNLSVFGGIWSLSAPPGEPHTLAAHTTWSQSYVLETDARWSMAEWNSKWRWSWCNGTGGVDFRIWPWVPSARVELQVRGVTPRSLEVWHNQTRVWRGQIGDRPQWIRLPELPVERGNLRLELRSEAPAISEGEANTAREISFACFGARLAK